MIKVRPSITLNDETDKLIGNPSAWNEYKCISFHNKEITNSSLPVESPSEKLTNMQLKAIWNNIDWHKVEEHVNRLQIRITKAVIQKKRKFSQEVELFTNPFSFCKTISGKKNNPK